MKFFLLSALVAVAFSKSVVEVNEDLTLWELFKIEHDKEYKTDDEETLRKQIFLENVKFVKEHNAKYEKGEVTFDVKINKFADMTPKEFRQMNGLRIPPGYNRTVKELVPVDNGELPETVDWREKGCVTPIKDQGQCGSCWAFSATASLEGLRCAKYGGLRSLSEQNLVDCSQAQGNQGCRGGLMTKAFNYIQKNNGIDSEESYPYTAQDGNCKYNPTNKAATCTGYYNLPSGSEKDLQMGVAMYGPISTGIDASQRSFHLYSSGVYVEPNCSSQKINHGVAAVGYGTFNGIDCWIVKNSWGKGWGENGYIYIARNYNNMCGIATMASYPTV